VEPDGDRPAGTLCAVSDTMISVTGRPAADPAAPGDPAGRRVLVTFLVALAAFFCMGAGWATALPANGTYDEGPHIYRAYGVATGQLYASDNLQRVPRSLVAGELNCTWAKRKPATCQVPAPHDRSLQPVVSTAAAYSPIYYLPVGLPMVAFKDHTGLLLGRYVSALLAALALAGALALAVALRNKLMVAAVLLVATPMTMNLAGAINPNGLEIACGVLFWAALLGLVRPPEGISERLTHRLVLLAAVSGSLLMTLRYLGPLLLGLVVLAGAALARRGRVRELLGRRDVRITGVVLGVALAVAVGWILSAHAEDIQDVQGRRQHFGPAQLLRLILTSRMPFWLNQLVGQFSYGETTMPSWLIVAWYALVAALVIPALLLAGRRFRWTIIALAAVCFAVLVALEVHFVNSVGWVSHGRYIMPTGVGIVLAAAFAGRWRAALGEPGVVRLTRAVVLVTLPLHLWALAQVMTRFQIGPTALINPLHGYLHHDPAVWLPPGGPLPPLALELAGVVTLGVLAWRLVTMPDGSRAVAG
jgi:hypothetical protein